MKLDLYPYPRILKTSLDYQITVNGQPVQVFHTTTGTFVSFGFEGSIELVITTKLPVKSATLRPLSRGVKPEIDGTRIVLRLEKAADYCLEVEGLPNLYLLLNPANVLKPSASKAGLHYFKAGQVYEVGQINLKDGEEVFIEGGAWVRGAIHAQNAQNIKIDGQGVLDGGYFANLPSERRKTIQLCKCQNVEVNHVTIVQPSNWTFYLHNCDNIRIEGLRELTHGNGSDGIDVSASRDVTIDGCFLATGDDNIVIKALESGLGTKTGAHVPNVERILAQNCVLLNIYSGRPLEIGHELLCDHVKDITFRNIDIIGSHGGPTFSINNSSYAVVSNVLYEDIRVEHYYSRLIDFRVIASRFAHTDKRGWIRDVLMKDIYVTQSLANPGYSTSLIGGFDAEHTVDNIHFKNFRLDEKVVLHPDEIDLFTRNCSKIEFET